jgi:hypothetical protein
MALWFKKKKTEAHKLLDFNVQSLATKLENAQLDLFKYRNDDAFKIIEEAIALARNIQILEINRAHTTKDSMTHLAHQQGRLEALTDLSRFLVMSADAEMYRARIKERPENKPRILVKKQQATEPVI